MTPGARKVYEGQFTWEQVERLNLDGYNIYYLPNRPSAYQPGKTVDGSQIDLFEYVFVDCDLKDKRYKSKQEFYDALGTFPLHASRIVDSGNGVHAYWKVSDLDAMSYLRLQRRLCRALHTDEAVGQIYQLMRVPNTVNTKHEDGLKLCEVVVEDGHVYTCEQLDKALPPITQADEDYCQVHYAKTYKLNGTQLEIDEKLPLKFAKLLRSSPEVKAIWSGEVEDRSKGDYRLGHIMFASSFTRDEALSVLVNTAKAIQRAPVHRASYAERIVDKIWIEEAASEEDAEDRLSSSVRELLASPDDDSLKGKRFPCWSWVDNTAHGFRLGQVIGMVAGAKIGKTAFCLNMFKGFVANNPDYIHMLVPLEQPAKELAARWRDVCGTDTRLHDMVEIVNNYDPKTGDYRNLSLSDIKDYVISFQKRTGKKVGCVVIDHIGVLKQEGRDVRSSIETICHQMKAFAVATNTLLVMQSQAPREKAGIGDIELNKDAAYGTVFFEAYCDYLVTLWQPLKRCADREACPPVAAFKFAAIRHKKPKRDVVKEDVCYRMFFDSETEELRELTQDEETAFDYWNNQCSNKRKQAAKRTDVGSYVSARWSGAPGSNSDSGAA